MSEIKSVLITGATGGIGEAVAKSLSSEGYELILVGRRPERLEALQKKLPGNSKIFQVDLTDSDDIEILFEKIRNDNIKLYGMVYCAGVCCIKPIKAMESGELEAMFRTNVFGFYEMCRHFQSPKVSEKGSSIVALSSYASLTNESGMSAYAMSKAAMNSQVIVLSKEFVKRGIRVNAILPANTMSKMGTGSTDWENEEIEELKKTQPLGPIPLSEITEMISFLMSERAAHVTGELFSISAGYRVS